MLYLTPPPTHGGWFMRDNLSHVVNMPVRARQTGGARKIDPLVSKGALTSLS